MVNYVVADPTKNITVLVTDEVPPEERPAVTAGLFASVPGCEQVGYITEPVLKGFALERLEMMGGEFCGNASLSLAAYIAKRDEITEPSQIEIECSGVDKTITVHIRPIGSEPGASYGIEGTQAAASGPHPSAKAYHSSGSHCSSGSQRTRYEGRIEMPAPEKTEYCDSHPVIFLPGIAHMIMPADRFTRRQVENNIKDYASRFETEAFGILLWDEAARYMTPCVYVKGSDTIVWENGCATGSTCIGWHRYKTLGAASTEVHQPGGIIKIDIVSGRPYLTGTVII